MSEAQTLESSELGALSPANPAAEASHSYRQILKATTFVGGAQVINIIFGLLKNKLLAVFLGPAGVGLAGLYTSVTGLVGAVTGLGVPMSGVRQIAESSAQSDERRVAATAATLGRITWLGGLVGMGLIMIFAAPICRLTFGNTDHIWGLRLVALVVLIEGIAAKQKAILQGLRRIGELSLCQVMGAVGGTVAAFPLVLLWHEHGVPGFLVVASTSAMLASWWFARQLKLKPIKLTRQEFRVELRGLLNIGVAALVTGFVGAGLVYLMRLVVMRRLGMDAVGMCQATWMLSSTYVGVVLAALGTDFYPRLTAVSTDRAACNRLINEQTEMGVLITFPGILATIVLAPWVLQLVYSRAFLPATDVIRWQILGDALKVVCWPLGVISFAQGRAKLFTATEVSFAAVQVTLLFLCVEWWQFEGVGIGFFLHQLLYTIVMLGVARALTGFSWSPNCRKIVVTVGVVTTGIFLLTRYASPSVSLPVGVAVTLLATWWSLKKSKELLGKDYLASIYRKIQQRFARKRPVGA
jgi:PST family polysaccharide transporter